MCRGDTGTVTAAPKCSPGSQLHGLVPQKPARQVPPDAVYAPNSGGPEPVPGKVPSKQKLFSQLCGPGLGNLAATKESWKDCTNTRPRLPIVVFQTPNWRTFEQPGSGDHLGRRKGETGRAWPRRVRFINEHWLPGGKCSAVQTQGRLGQCLARLPREAQAHVTNKRWAPTGQNFP